MLHCARQHFDSVTLFELRWKIITSWNVKQQTKGKSRSEHSWVPSVKRLVINCHKSHTHTQKAFFPENKKQLTVAICRAFNLRWMMLCSNDLLSCRDSSWPKRGRACVQPIWRMRNLMPRQLRVAIQPIHCLIHQRSSRVGNSYNNSRAKYRPNPSATAALPMHRPAINNSEGKPSTSLSASDKKWPSSKTIRLPKTSKVSGQTKQNVCHWLVL